MGFVTATLAQELSFTGSLKTHDGRPVAYANVSLTLENGQVLTFGSSDAKGNFILTLSDSLANRRDLLLAVNHLGYGKVAMPFQSSQKHYVILMEEQTIDLQEVEVKSRPKINQSGDTLSYDVGSFAKAEDRSIADVLRRMPGIEIEDSGQIKYNGKAISNFYIDGDDLLNDRYAIGSKTIPHDMVKDIEILQNHQPIKALQDKSLSENIALNLKIKEEAKLQWKGQAKTGLGLPEQYDLELNGMLFNKKYKLFNLAKANNIGIDLQNDLRAFNEDNKRAAIDDNRPTGLLSSGTAPEPNLPKNRYYFNHSEELNANNLINLKNGLQLKTNIGLWLDKNQMNYNSFNEVYFDQDTIRYREDQRVSAQPYQVHLALQAKSNKANYYFSNTLQLDLDGSTQESSLNTNIMQIEQQLDVTTRNFSNSLEYIPHTSNNIFRVNWDLYHDQIPQSLSIYPGIQEEILHDSLAYQCTQQRIETPTWFSNFSLGYTIPKGSIKQHYRLGTLNEWQHMYSSLLLMEPDDSFTISENIKDNHLHWQRHRLMASAVYEFKDAHWEAQLSLPLAWQYIHYNDSGFDLDEQQHKLLFTPSWRLKYYTTAEDYLALQYTGNNKMGNINGIYAGTILSNYRNLSGNSSGLQEQHIHNGGLQYNFQRNISMLFINAGINYSRTIASAIASRTVDSTISRTEWLPYQNISSNLSLNGGISKYLFDLDATTGLKLSWNRAQFSQLMNGQLMPYQHVSFTLSPSIKVRLWDIVEANYETNATWTSSRLSPEAQLNIPHQQIYTLDQSMNLSCTPLSHSFIQISGRHLYTNQAQMENINYFFVDATFRYQLNKQRIDFQLDLTNITNIQQYETYSLSANQFGYQRYDLRGRMLMLRASFYL